MKKYPVRISTKAIIIYNKHLLVIKHQQNSKEYFTLPGGGVNKNENLSTGLKRECMEELGAEIEIEDIVFVRDYIADNHEFAKQDPGFHQVEIMFLCKILNPNSLHKQTEPDKTQIGFEWLPLENIKNLPLYPKVLSMKIMKIYQNQLMKVYLGDVN